MKIKFLIFILAMSLFFASAKKGWGACKEYVCDFYGPVIVFGTAAGYGFYSIAKTSWGLTGLKTIMVLEIVREVNEIVHELKY